MKFLPYESFILRILVFVGLFGLAARYLIGVSVNSIEYICAFLIISSAICLGVWIRRFDKNMALSLYLTSAGLYFILGLVAHIYIDGFLPIVFPRVDHILVEVDALFGFHWPDFAMFFSKIPHSAEVMKFIYNSALVQLLMIMLVFCISDRHRDLGLFNLTFALSTIFTIAIWILFPSFGSTSFFDLPNDVLAQMPIIADPAYGKSLVTMSVEGVDVIKPDLLKGTIAFPSFHAVMAIMCVAFTRQFKLVWPFAIVLNILMVPCIIVQGGHHLTDVFGGVAVFLVAYACSAKIMRKINAPTFKPVSGSEVPGIPQHV